MKQENLFTVLLSSHVSEKSYAPDQYAFKVKRTATKLDIKSSVEYLFKVSVQSVRVCNIKAKSKRFGRIKGNHSAWKKAYVTLMKGQEISEIIGN